MFTQMTVFLVLCKNVRNKNFPIFSLFFLFRHWGKEVVLKFQLDLSGLVKK